MKNHPFSHLLIGLSLVALPFLGGCTQNKAGSNPLVSAANAEPASAESDLAAVTEASTNAPVVAEAGMMELAQPAAVAGVETSAIAEAGVATETNAPVTELKPPPNVRLSPVLSEVVKLVHAGVDQPVLYSFITNTTGYFALGADEIVYLNDLGVSGDVITTMMEHDQALRELRLSAVQQTWAVSSNQITEVPQAVEAESAAAPSYIDPPAMEVEPVYVSDNYFYDTLTPYGSWVYVTGYGRCWRPTVAIRNPGWRPYVDRGRWVSTDGGWYWYSDYTWGATAFHYGRWFDDNRWGWCWWPDTVWAPSWVNWRYTSDYCGWAPLPPTACYQPGFGMMYQSGSVGISFGFGLGVSSYAFVPWGSFCSPRPYQYCLPASRAVHVYNNSKPVNHFEAGGHGRVYNRGVAPDRVREYSRSEVRTVSLREQNGRGARAERLERDGQTLSVRRPSLIPTTVAEVNNSERTTRGSVRVNSPATIETRATQPATPTATANFGRTEPRSERGNATRPVTRSTVPVATVNPTPQAKPVVASPTRVESRPVRERESQAEVQPVNRTRPSTTVVRAPAMEVQPVTPTAPTPRVEQPRVIQSTPQPVARPTAPSTSVVVIGGRNNTRPQGRDYSVWSTPTPTPTPSAPQTVDRGNFSSRPSPSPVVSTPVPANDTPAPASRFQSDRNSSAARPENRGSYSTPRPGQVITPSARPTPTPSYTPRPATPTPAPSYTPRPAPSAARVESRPAPSSPTPAAPSRPTSPSPSQGQRPR